MFILPLALIALVLGYQTYLLAIKEKEGVKILGQMIGIFVMIASVLAIGCGIAKCMKSHTCHRMGSGSITSYDCPKSAAKGSNCPIAPESAD